jgi:hypothetical protein
MHERLIITWRRCCGARRSGYASVMTESDPRGESTAEQAGIVDQQGAALEAMEDDDHKHGEDESREEPNVGPMADDPMEGEAPTG